MDQIFLKIASYRDAELPRTINDALTQAAHPQRLIFGICWQYDERTLLDLDPYIDHPNFRVHQSHYTESQGCCWARHQTDLLYGGEKYMLQIDAHTRFAKDWDDRFISMLESLPAQKPILTTYPAPFEYRGAKEHRFDDRGVQKLALKNIRKDLTTAFKTIPVGDTSMLHSSQFLAAGQIFTLGEFCNEVQYDPQLYYSGEEISLSARAYTHGYDFYCPNEDLLWHLYQHSMPVHSADHRENRHQLALERLQTLLTGNHQQLGRYGLGDERTLADYESFCGIDFSERANRSPRETQMSSELRLDLSAIEQRPDYDFWIFTLISSDDEELYRRDLKKDEIPSRDQPILSIEATLADQPVSYSILPHSTEQGYLPRVVLELPQA